MRTFIGRGLAGGGGEIVGGIGSSAGLNVTVSFAIRRKGGEEKEGKGGFRGGRFLSMLITVAGVNHDRPGARSAKWVRAGWLAGWPSPNRRGSAG